MAQAGEGDFVFVDPPYTVAHDNNGFVKYNEHIFSWDDQVRLRDCVVNARRRGAGILVLNAAHASIRELYEPCGYIHEVHRQSVLAGTASARRPVREFAIQVGFQTSAAV